MTPRALWSLDVGDDSGWFWICVCQTRREALHKARYYFCQYPKYRILKWVRP